MLERVAHLLPSELSVVLSRMPVKAQEGLEEIRIRDNRPLEVWTLGVSTFVSSSGSLSDNPDGAYKPSYEVCRKLLERMTNHSVYAMEEELRRGYITVEGGHRIGLAGRTVLEEGRVRGIRDIGGFNVRIARDVTGVSGQTLPQLIDRSNRTIASTLIVGAPRQGKTTYIRDLARAISYGRWQSPQALGWSGRKVGIVDERSEIAACVRGIPTFDVGPRTDVMDACPKAEGMMMMIRSMSPEVLIVDEIGRDEDVEAIREAVRAGVSVVATAHAGDWEEAASRPAIKRLLQEGSFARGVVLRRTITGLTVKVVDLTAAETSVGFAGGTVGSAARAAGHSTASPREPTARAGDAHAP
ncbi:stage III sporulation protein AA [Paenibacillus cellulosilyticus]|uniref:Stage III sporulation protein AA n=1 Tax=Paenibacillus cellulosilyticus TaxID=375489 RepID=A0A2V2YYZ0_9BACL|nr:stage III sporulation protein AA [Paenibacillus cellulosilyticus]PWW05664.1 stage III sporulation protein AA [Paenibacillus cellulosilyticus]QKS45312.1 stage III sporulation protein AA [Paenibacillus cellulosilyticus]